MRFYCKLQYNKVRKISTLLRCIKIFFTLKFNLICQVQSPTDSFLREMGCKSCPNNWAGRKTNFNYKKKEKTILLNLRAGEYIYDWMPHQWGPFHSGHAAYTKPGKNIQDQRSHYGGQCKGTLLRPLTGRFWDFSSSRIASFDFKIMESELCSIPK